MRKSLAMYSLAMLIAAVGCTTNNNPGNGQPANAPATVPSSTPGASSGSTTTNPPMTSAILPKTPAQRAAASVDAIAVLAADQAYRGRVLGAANPSPNAPVVTTPAVAEPINPAPLVNPGTTVNSSITSPATTAISGGGGGGSDAAALFAAPVIAGPVNGGTTAATTGTANAGFVAPLTSGETVVAPVTGVAAVPVTSQTAIAASTATRPMGTTLTQNAVPAATATVPAVPAATPTNVTAPLRSTSVPTSAATNGATGRVVTPRPVSSSQPVRVDRDSAGNVIVTNVTAPSTSGTMTTTSTTRTRAVTSAPAGTTQPSRMQRILNFFRGRSVTSSPAQPKKK